VLGPRLGERLAAELRLAGESAEGARLAIVELSEAVCVAAAPSLLAKSDSEQQTVHYREHIVGLLCEEARRILEQTLTRSEPAPTPAAERRVVALSNVFRRLRSA
jgi:hypothetical protein